MMVHIRIKAGQDVFDVLHKRLAQEGIRAGAITSVIGAVDSCRLSTMPKDDATRDIVIDYHEPLEIMGNGAVADGVPHIHCVAGREGNVAVAGHLHAATVGTWFVDVFVMPTASSALID